MLPRSTYPLILLTTLPHNGDVLALRRFEWSPAARAAAAEAHKPSVSHAVGLGLMHELLEVAHENSGK